MRAKGSTQRDWTKEEENQLRDLAKKGYTDNKIAKLLDRTKGSVSSKRDSMKIKKHTRYSKEIKKDKVDIEAITYKPKKLKIGKTYKVREKGFIKWGDTNNNFIGKVIEEYPSYYLLDLGNRTDTVLKTMMMDLKIKEVG